MYKINLEAVDTDGAIQEAEHAVAGDTRLDFLRKAGLTGGAVMGGGAVMAALAPEAFAAKTGKKKGHGRPPTKLFGSGDIGILNYALTLEYLESAFYNDAVASITFNDPKLANLAKVIAKDEMAHVSFLESAIPSSKRVRKPTFDFMGTTKDQAKFFATAQVLENTGVLAYTGQGFNIAKPAYLKAALSILTIEARHAGAIGLVNDPSAEAIAVNGAFDHGATATAVLAAAGPFVTGNLGFGNGK